jgi:hypothetical protein
MPTKSEYREYIQSEAWQKRRKEFLAAYPHCNRCTVPRELAVIAYDQDLHVHHKSYARVGDELNEDLEPLCKRCHEIETFGESKLHKVKNAECLCCDALTWNLVDRLCHWCWTLSLIGGGAGVPGNEFWILVRPPHMNEPRELGFPARMEGNYVVVMADYFVDGTVLPILGAENLISFPKVDSNLKDKLAASEN